MTDRLYNLILRRPWATFFRVFILVYSVEKQEFLYVLIFIIAFSLWVLESVALYIDPELYTGKLIAAANILLFIMVACVAVIHLGPYINRI